MSNSHSVDCLLKCKEFLNQCSLSLEAFLLLTYTSWFPWFFQFEGTSVLDSLSEVFVLDNVIQKFFESPIQISCILSTCLEIRDVSLFSQLLGFVFANSFLIYHVNLISKKDNFSVILSVSLYLTEPVTYVFVAWLISDVINQYDSCG